MQRCCFNVLTVATHYKIILLVTSAMCDGARFMGRSHIRWCAAPVKTSRVFLLAKHSNAQRSACVNGPLGVAYRLDVCTKRRFLPWLQIYYAPATDSAWALLECGNAICSVKKVAHTRLPSVGFRSWSRFLAVSLQVMWVINPAVGCHYFQPRLQLLLQPLRGMLPISLLGEQRHDGCEQFA